MRKVPLSPAPSSADERAWRDWVTRRLDEIIKASGVPTPGTEVNTPFNVVEILKNFSLTGVVSPAQIAATQNNYAPTGIETCNVLRLTSDASRSITGLLAADPNTRQGQIILIVNAGAFDIILEDEHASSDAANRFDLSADITLPGDTMIAVWYDAATDRWRAFGGPASFPGIDDNATGERLQIEDTILQVGSTVSASEYWIARQIADGLLGIGGDDAVDQGANIRLYGAGHATKANDFDFRQGSTVIAQWDSSAALFTFTNDVTLNGGAFYIGEIAAARTDYAGYGQFWVKDDAPNIPKFTDDAGTDFTLAAHSATPSNDDFLQRKSGVWTPRTVAQVITDLNAANVIQTVTANWKGDTGDPVLNNGTMNARVEKIGNFLWVYIEVTMGNTTTFGTGNWYFTLPSPYNGNAAYSATGAAFMLDSGTAFFVATAYIASGTNKIYVCPPGANFLNSAVPFTWATNDYLRFSIMIPLA